MFNIEFLLIFSSICLILNSYVSFITLERKYSFHTTLFLLGLSTVAITTGISLVASYTINVPIFSLFYLIFFFIIPLHILFKDTLYQKLFILSSSIIIQLVILLLSITIQAYVFIDFKFDISNMYFIYMLYCTFSIISLIIFYRNFSINFKEMKNVIRTDQWPVYTIFPVYCAIYLSTICLQDNIFTVNIWQFLSTSFIIAIISYLYILFAKILVSNYYQEKERYEKEQYKLITSTQKNYYEMLNKKMEESRYLRHDFKHNVALLNSLLDNNQIQEAKEYLYTLNIKILESQIVRYTRNDIINATITHFMNIASESNIHISQDIKISDITPIDNYDFCIVLGNLLDNAITATSKDSVTDKHIHITIAELQNIIIIKVNNKFDGVVNKKDDQYLTTKISGGIGLQSIRSIVNKYNGTMSITNESNTFEVNVALNRY